MKNELEIRQALNDHLALIKLRELELGLEECMTDAPVGKWAAVVAALAWVLDHDLHYPNGCPIVSTLKIFRDWKREMEARA